MKGLTEKQKEILDFIEHFCAREGMSPTVYEIASYFEIKSATSFAHLRALQRKGYITRSSKARSLALTKTASMPKHLSLTLSVPILGRISAGVPLFAEENIEENIQFDPTLLPRSSGGREIFGLKINGESMRDMGLLDGDIVVAEAKQTASIGDIVIVMIDGETTVKQLFINNAQVELRPANPEFQSTFYPLDKIEIQGVVIAMSRTYK